MTRTRAVVAALVGAAVSSSCSGGGGDDPPPPPPESFLDTLQGAWATPCFNPGGGVPDQRQTYAYTGTTRVLETTSYPSRDASCTGAGTPQPALSITFTVGGTRAATLAGASVTAHEVDTVVNGAPVYTIVYVDTARTPRVMYGGDSRATLGRDGSRPDLRPTVLEDWRPRVKGGGAPPPDPVGALLQGSWTACRAGAPDRRVIDHIVGATSTVTTLEYPSADGTCAGAAAFAGSSTATFLVGANVPATSSGAPVVARAVDVSPPGNPVSYDVVLVDTESDPDRLLTGDVDAESGRDGTAPGRRPRILGDAWTRSAPLGESATTLEALQGTWVACYNEGDATGDVRESLAVSGTSVAVLALRFASTDASCGGTGTEETSFTLTIVLGGTAPATLLDGLVAAREVDLGRGEKAFSILWVDGSTTPPVLYTGDDVVNPYRDASAPDRRPTVLQAGKPRIREAAP